MKKLHDPGEEILFILYGIWRRVAWLPYDIQRWFKHAIWMEIAKKQSLQKMVAHKQQTLDGLWQAGNMICKYKETKDHRIAETVLNSHIVSGDWQVLSQEEIDMLLAGIENNFKAEESIIKEEMQLYKFEQEFKKRFNNKQSQEYSHLLKTWNDEWYIKRKRHVFNLNR